MLQGQKYATLHALKMEEGEYWRLLDVGKSKEEDSSLELPEKNTTTAHTLILASSKTHVRFIELQVNNFVLS